MTQVQKLRLIVVLTLLLITVLYAAEDSVHTYKKQFGLGYAISTVFSPQGDRYAIASCDGNVRIYDTENKLVKMLESGSASACVKIDWSLDGDYLVIAQHENEIVLWDTSQTNPVKRVKTDFDWITQLTFTTDQKVIAGSYRDSAAILWDFKESNIQKRWESLSLDYGASFSREGLYFISDRKDTVNESGDFTSCRKLSALNTPFQSAAVFWDSYSAVFNKSGTLLAVDSAEFMKVIRLNTLETVYQFPKLGKIMAFTQNDSVLVCAVNDSLYEYRLATNTIESAFPFVQDPVNNWGEAINDNLDLVNITYDDPFIYSVKTGKKDTLTDYNMVTNFCGLSADKKYAVMNVFNKGIEVYECATGKIANTLHNNSLTRTFSFSKESPYLLTSSFDDITFWDMNSGFTKTIKDDAKYHYAAVYSPLHKQILYSYGEQDSAGQDSTYVTLYDYEKDSTLYTVSYPVRGYTWLKSPLKFSGDGSRFGIVLDGDVYIHNAMTGEKVAEFLSDSGHEVSDFDLNYSGTRLMVGDGFGRASFVKYSTKAALLNLPTMDTLQTYTGLMAEILTIEFHPHDSLVMFGSWGEAILCDVNTGSIKSRLMGSVRGGGFSDDGSLFYGVGTTLRLWDIATEEAILKSAINDNPRAFSLLGTTGKTLHFSLPEKMKSDVEVSVFDLRGRVLQSKQLHIKGRLGYLSFDNTLAAGQYIYRVNVDKKNVQSGRFFVR